MDIKSIPLSDISNVLMNKEASESLMIDGKDLEKQYGFYSSKSNSDQEVFRAAGIIDNFSRATNANMIRLYKNFLDDYKDIRRAFSRSAVRDNINVQREIVMKERELIQRTIRLMDSVPESGAINLAVFSAVVACTIGLSTCALSLPAEALGMYTRIPEGVAATAAIAQAPGMVYIVMKMIGMNVKSHDQSNSVLTSQRTTGVLSKQILIGKLNNLLAKTDKKLQHILSRQLLETNAQVISAMHKYNEESVSKLVAKVDEMQRGLEKDLVGTTNKYFPNVKNQPNSNAKASIQQPKNTILEDPNTIAKVKKWNTLSDAQKQVITNLKKSYAENVTWINNCNNKNSQEYINRVNLAKNQAGQIRNLVKQLDA